MKMNALLTHLPSSIRAPIAYALSHYDRSVHELRFRVGYPPSITSFDRNLFISKSGDVHVIPRNDFIIGREELSAIFLSACQHSVYAYSKELKNGFITLAGGYRMGIAGRFVYDGGSIQTVSDISSLSIRIPDEKKGCAAPIIPFLFVEGSIRSCAVISPPGGGKTTLLRDTARSLSMRGKRVCVIDERHELAGCRDGIPSFELGPLTDVLDSCSKTDGLSCALRCLSPNVIIMDELGEEKESHMILQGINGGVATVFSLHAASLQQAVRRLALHVLLRNKALELIVLLSDASSPGKIARIYDLTDREDAQLVEDAWNSSA